MPPRAARRNTWNPNSVRNIPRTPARSGTQQVGPAECLSRHLWILSTYFMNIYHFFWHLENMKIYENINIFIFSIFKWCKLYVLRFQLFLSEVFNVFYSVAVMKGSRVCGFCGVWCHGWILIVVGERPSISEKPTKKMSDTPENLQFNYVFVLFGVHIMCAYIYIYKWMSSYMSNIICQIVYYLYIYICQNLFHIFYKCVYIYYLSYCISWSTNQPVKPCLAFPRTHMTHMPRVLLRTRLSGGHGWVSSKTLPEILR